MLRSTMIQPTNRLLAVAESQNYRCAYCGVTTVVGDPENPISATIDHVHPLSQGGKRTRENEVLACRLCNGGRGAIDAIVYFYIVQKLGRAKAVIEAKRMHGPIARNRAHDRAKKPKLKAQAPPAHVEQACAKVLSMTYGPFERGPMISRKMRKKIREGFVGHNFKFGEASSEKA